MNNPKYQVFSKKPDYQTFTYSNEDRKQKFADTLGSFGCLINIIVFLAVWFVGSMMLGFVGINYLPGYSPSDNKAHYILFGCAIVISFVVVSWTNKVLQRKKIASQEQFESDELNKKEEIRVKNEAESLTKKIMEIYQTSLELQTELPEYLEEVDAWLEEAEEEYEANAFAPFWDAVEEAVGWLGDFYDDANEIAGNADRYYQNLNGVQHTFPVFPVTLQTIPDASPQIERLRRVVRLGQTNFQFANIWEHRKTREVMIAGFRTLNEAVYELGNRIEDSISNLEESISSDVAKLIEEQIKTRESVNKIGEAFDARTLEQNKMLDNIQHHRKPKPKDTPTKK